MEKSVKQVAVFWVIRCLNRRWHIRKRGAIPPLNLHDRDGFTREITAIIVKTISSTAACLSKERYPGFFFILIERLHLQHTLISVILVWSDIWCYDTVERVHSSFSMLLLFPGNCVWYEWILSYRIAMELDAGMIAIAWARDIRRSRYLSITRDSVGFHIPCFPYISEDCYVCEALYLSYGVKLLGVSLDWLLLRRPTLWPGFRLPLLCVFF